MKIRQVSFHDIGDYFIARNLVLIRWSAAVCAFEATVYTKRQSGFIQELSPETIDFANINGTEES